MPARLPIIPRAHIHDGFRIKHRDIIVVRKFFGGTWLHGGRISRIEFLAIGFRIFRIAFGQRRDQRICSQRSFCGSGERLRLLDGREGGLHRFLRHRQIDVGAEHKRFAPKAHGAMRIEFLGLAESALRFGVIEGVSEPQPLIEIILRGRARGW